MESSSPTVGRMMAGTGSEVDWESMCRLLAALDVTPSRGGDDQVLLDELSASALRQVERNINARAPIGDKVFLTDEEFYQLKSLAQYGMRHLCARVGLGGRNEDKEAA